MLLADARRKQEKRTAKRVANRKSASSSRARKKALIDEMTKANARLRRQAMILSLLPDLVIAITVDGTITFCSAQVERVLRHQIQHLVGANLEAILTPSSREKLRQLVWELLAADQTATFGPDVEGVTSSGNHAAVVKSSDGENGSGNQSSSSAREVSSGGEAVPVSEQSFPLKVVKVESQSASPEDNSDISASNG
jgi:PAS domain-containing protein